jgi:DNA-directed RNA polymerase specialized sigma24 family protein
VFHESVEAARMVRRVEKAGAWLFRVARIRITDLLRRKRTRGFEQSSGAAGDSKGEAAQESNEDRLPSLGAGPEAFTRGDCCSKNSPTHWRNCSEAQRDVFIVHELEGRSFGEFADESGGGVNALLPRKRYAVLHLRRRLQAIHDDFVEP